MSDFEDKRPETQPPVPAWDNPKHARKDVPSTSNAAFKDAYDYLVARYPNKEDFELFLEQAKSLAIVDPRRALSDDGPLGFEFDLKNYDFVPRLDRIARILGADEQKQKELRLLLVRLVSIAAFTVGIVTLLLRQGVNANLSTIIDILVALLIGSSARIFTDHNIQQFVEFFFSSSDSDFPTSDDDGSEDITMEQLMAAYLSKKS